MRQFENSLPCNGPYDVQPPEMYRNMYYLLFIARKKRTFIFASAMQKKLSYRKLVYAAYGFLILLSLSWVIAGLYAGGGINYNALIMLVIFTIQAYYNHRIANLVVGIIVLLMSIFGTLHFVAWGGKAGFDPFIYGMVGAGVLSIAASIILMFSYLKMSFEGKDLI